MLATDFIQHLARELVGPLLQRRIELTPHDPIPRRRLRRDGGQVIDCLGDRLESEGADVLERTQHRQGGEMHMGLDETRKNHLSLEVEFKQARGGVRSVLAGSDPLDPTLATQHGVRHGGGDVHRQDLGVADEGRGGRIPLGGALQRMGVRCQVDLCETQHFAEDIRAAGARKGIGCMSGRRE